MFDLKPLIAKLDELNNTLSNLTSLIEKDIRLEQEILQELKVKK